MYCLLSLIAYRGTDIVGSDVSFKNNHGQFDITLSVKTNSYVSIHIITAPAKITCNDFRITIRLEFSDSENVSH